MLPPLDSRDQRALLVFFGGVIILFMFFAGGAYIGRWPRQLGSDRPAGIGARSDSERYLVEIAVVDTMEKAGDIVQQFRKKYTSARGVYDPSDRLYHVYAGPYPTIDEANTVADDLRRGGTQSVVVKPYSSK